MLIFIQTMTGKTITIEFDVGATFLQIKQKIAAIEAININSQQLIFAGKRMKDSDIITHEIYLAGTLHLVLKLNEVYHPDFQNKFDTDDIELLWSVNYLQDTDTSFPSKTYTLIASSDLATAYESFQKRLAAEAKGRVTYLSLTAIRKSDREKAILDKAPQKYQPNSGKIIYEHISGSELPIPIRPLIVAVPKEKGGFEIIQDVNREIHFSPKYQSKLIQLMATLNQPVAQQAIKPLLQNVSKPEIKELIDLDDPQFQTINAVINTEIDFNIPDNANEKELFDLKRSLQEFLNRLANLNKLPVDVPKDLNLVNLLLLHLNGRDRYLNAQISDQKLIEYVRQLVGQRLNEMNPKPSIIVEPQPIISNEIESKQANYLMFDMGGVLAGSIVDDAKQISERDLILKKYDDWGGFQILKNGVQIINDINELSNRYGYKMVLHSKDFEADQLELIEGLRQDCVNKGIPFPQIVGMGVYDQKRFANYPSTAPNIYQLKNGTIVAGWGIDDSNGKTSLRRALEKSLGFIPGNNHVVFDDGASIVKEAIAETYSAYLIHDVQQPLDVAVRKVLVAAQLAARDNVIKEDVDLVPAVYDYKNFSADLKSHIGLMEQKWRHEQGLTTEEYWHQLPLVKQHEFLANFKPKVLAVANPMIHFNQNSYQSLPLEFRQFLSSRTEEIRGQWGNLSTTEYWNQLGQDEQNGLQLEFFTECLKQNSKDENRIIL